MYAVIDEDVDGAKDENRQWFENIDITDLSPAEVFRAVWPLLKKRGWKVTSGSGLYNYFYLSPNTKKKTGILGETMFGTEEEVVSFIVK